MVWKCERIFFQNIFIILIFFIYRTFVKKTFNLYIVKSYNFNLRLEDYRDDRFVKKKDIKNIKSEDPLDVCQQYFVLGTMIPYETILVMSKLIFKVPSFDSVCLKLQYEIPKYLYKNEKREKGSLKE